MSDNTHNFPVDQYGALDLRASRPEPTKNINGDVIHSLTQRSLSFDSTKFPKSFVRTCSSGSRSIKNDKTIESSTKGNKSTEVLGKSHFSNIFKSPRVFGKSIESNSSSGILSGNVATELVSSNSLHNVSKPSISSDSIVSPDRTTRYSVAEISQIPSGGFST